MSLDTIGACLLVLALSVLVWPRAHLRLMRDCPKCGADMAPMRFCASVGGDYWYQRNCTNSGCGWSRSVD